MNNNIYRIDYENIPIHSRVIIYGVGRAGVSYIKSIKKTKRLQIAAVIDKNHQGKICEGFFVEAPQNISNYDFDYILLSMELEENANNVIEGLLGYGIKLEKILWSGKNITGAEKCEFEFEKFLLRHIPDSVNRIFIFMIPEHGNVGDYAIAYSELEFLKEYFPEYAVFTITTTEWIQSKSAFVNIISPFDIVMFNGGGFIGDLWENDCNVYRDIIDTFEDNRVIFFPNTIGFKDRISGNIVIETEMQWLASKQNVFIMLREVRSYELMRKYTNRCRLYPDMVLYQMINKKIIKNTDSNGVLLCIRNDRESTTDTDRIKECLKMSDIPYDELELNAEMYMPFQDGRAYISKICSEMKRYECVITDRLHGMLLSVVSGVPCIAFDNSTKKVSGVYMWIKDMNTVSLCDIEEIGDIRNKIENVISDSDRECKFLEDYFKDMAVYIRSIVEESR